MARIDDRMLDVNQYGVLRIPLPVWAALIFLARHWVIGFAVMISAIVNQETLRVLSSSFGWEVLAIELPAVLVLWVCARRAPEAGLVVRKLWPLARPIAAGTAVLHLGYVVWYLANSGYWLPWPELFLASCALIDLAIVRALYTSEHLRQVFSEFPSPLVK